MSLPKDDDARKRIKPFAGFFCYFPDAIAAVAELSFLANEKHNPGEPMHWAKDKSTEQRESMARHLLDEAAGGPLSRDQYEAAGKYWAILHAVSTAWRSMAQLQTLADQGHNIFAEQLGPISNEELDELPEGETTGDFIGNCEFEEGTLDGWDSRVAHDIAGEPYKLGAADFPQHPPQGVMPCENGAHGPEGVTAPTMTSKLLNRLRSFYESTGKPPKRLHIGREAHAELRQELESAVMPPNTQSVEYAMDYGTSTVTEFCGVAVRKIGDDEGYPPYAVYLTNR